MFIVWGKREQRRREGYAADFCELCRSIQAFEVTGVTMRSHVYYLCYGQGDFVGYERQCRKCHVATTGNQRGYNTFSKKLLPIAELKRVTFPNLQEVHRERLALEEKARNPSFLSRDERMNIISAPFLMLATKVEKRFAGIHIDKEVGIALGVTFALFMFSPSVVRLFTDEVNVAVQVGLVFIGLGAAWTTWKGITSGRRFFKQQIIPAIVKSIGSLRPTNGEVELVLKQLARNQLKIGSKLKVEDLREQLDQMASGGSATST